MRNIVICLGILLFSCDSKTEKESASKSEFTYLVLIDENNKCIVYLKENIENVILRNNDNETILKFNELTKEYIKYLTTIEIEISKKNSGFLFNNQGYSKKGKEFISITEKYKIEIEKLVDSENLIKRLNLVLTTKDIKHIKNGIGENNQTDKIESEIFYIKHLDYYFKDLPNNQALALISFKKKSLLEIENEFIGTLKSE